MRWKSLIGLRVKNMGSLEAGAKLINTRNGQVFKVLLDSCVGYGGQCRRLPWAALAVEEHGWHKHHFWNCGFPVWLHMPSPSAPEALLWASWQEASRRKGRTKKCIFLSSPNTYSSGIWMKNTYLVTFQAPLQERTGKTKQNKTKTQLLNQTQKAQSCFFSVLVCSLFKREEKRNLVFKPTCWQTVCFYLIYTSFAWIKSTGTVLWLNSAIEMIERGLDHWLLCHRAIRSAFSHHMSFKTQLWRLIENTDSFPPGHAESTTDCR